jgi:hypothetical protein
VVAGRRYTTLHADCTCARPCHLTTRASRDGSSCYNNRGQVFATSDNLASTIKPHWSSNRGEGKGMGNVVDVHAMKSLNRWQGGPQSRRACLRKEKNLLRLPGIELQGGSVLHCLLSELLATYRTFTIKVVQVINPDFLGNEGDSCTEVCIAVVRIICKTTIWTCKFLI